MGTLKKNVAANFGSSLFVGLMNLGFVPLYIHFMGIESYGLVGIFSTLLSLFALLDMGLGATLNREMARLGAQKNKIIDMRELLRTLEIPYWVVALLIGVVVVLLSPVLAYHWFNPKTLSASTVQKAVLYMGIAIAFQWPFSFYSGGLAGRQKQVLLGVLNIVMAALRGGGALVILWLVSPTIEAFFLWQILISAFQTALAAYFLWGSLPANGHQPRFRKKMLLEIWRFATGVTGITLLSTILSQMDKIILSRMLSMETFGYYNVASTLAMTLYRFVGPVFSATFPSLTHFYELKNDLELANLYHKSAQLVSVLILPIALIIAFFSWNILFLWTRDPVTAEKAHLLVSVLVIGMAMNGLMNIPYALQLAAGWTKLNFFVNLASVFVMVPLTVFFTQLYGAVGAASNWVIVNGAYILIIIPIMHQRLLKREMGEWYLRDVLFPLIGILVVVVGARFVFSLNGLGFISQVACLGLIWALATLTAALLAPAIRHIGFHTLSKWRSR